MSFSAAEQVCLQVSCKSCRRHASHRWAVSAHNNGLTTPRSVFRT